jgi:hypothetical protein
MTEETTEKRPDDPIRILKGGVPHTDPPVTLRQGLTLKAISELSTHPIMRDPFLEALRFVLQEDLDYVDMLLTYGIIKTEAEHKHLRTHWYPKDWDPNKPTPDAWWKDCQPLFKKIVPGLIDAFERAKTSNLAVAYYWMVVNDWPDVDAKDKVFTRVYSNEQHILLVKFTPPPPHP